MLRISKLAIKINYLDENEEIKFVFPTFNFTEGVNIIWDKGKNSVGKSTCINSIFYGLGLEELLGGKGTNTMKPVLHKNIIIGGKTYAVYETYVHLEINNGDNCVTIQRAVKGINRNTKLIRVYDSNLENIYSAPYKDYFIHDPGSAQNEFGFHNYLEKFLKINLPIVPYNNGRSGKLYLQAISNLFFIEQVKGWTGFNVQKVYYGIKNIEKISIEYILGCTTNDLDEIRNKLRLKLKEEKNKWDWVNKKIIEELSTTGEKISGVDNNIKTFTKDNIENIKLSGRSMNQIKKDLIDKIDYIDSLKNKSINNNISYINEELKRNEKILYELEVQYRREKDKFILKEIYYKSLLEQRNELEVTIRRYQDIIKLKQLGSEAEFKFLNSKCPVCDNKIQQSLLPKNINTEVMSNEDNLVFLKDEKKIVEIAILENKKLIDNYEINLKSKEKVLDEVRSQIRSIKNDLIDIAELPSESIINQKYLYKEQLNRIMEIDNNIEKYYDILEIIQVNINNLTKQINDLKVSSISEEDKEKVNIFQTEFRSLLDTFGYTSTDIRNIKLSEERYSPICDGYHLMYDSAGSDFIRAIWAYLLGLYKASIKIMGNHPGIFIFDEPFQQQVSEYSKLKFIDEIKSLKCQAIIATSIAENDISKLVDDKTNLIIIEESFVDYGILV